MAAFDFDTSEKTKLFLELYRDAVRTKLRAEIMPIAEQIVDQAVIAAVDDLKVSIERSADDFRNKFELHISTE